LSLCWYSTVLTTMALWEVFKSVKQGFPTVFCRTL
jgi:hypothetical protein